MQQAIDDPRTWRRRARSASVSASSERSASPEVVGILRRRDDTVRVAHAPPPVEQSPVVPSATEGLVSVSLRKARYGNSLIVEQALDVEAAGYLDRRWLVSKKKNKTLGDFVNTWKKAILNTSSDADRMVIDRDIVNTWT